MTSQAAYIQAASVYRRTATSVSPLTGVVMLYDGVIAELTRTIVALEGKHLDEAFAHLETATTILRGLCHNLDFERGGPIAERMRDTYMRLIMSALHALGKPDATSRLKKLIGAITGLRDAWAEVRLQQAKLATAKP